MRQLIMAAALMSAISQVEAYCDPVEPCYRANSRSEKGDVRVAEPNSIEMEAALKSRIRGSQYLGIAIDNVQKVRCVKIDDHQHSYQRTYRVNFNIDCNVNLVACAANYVSTGRENRGVFSNLASGWFFHDPE